MFTRYWQWKEKNKALIQTRLPENWRRGSWGWRGGGLDGLLSSGDQGKYEACLRGILVVWQGLGISRPCDQATLAKEARDNGIRWRTRSKSLLLFSPLSLFPFFQSLHKSPLISLFPSVVHISVSPLQGEAVKRKDGEKTIYCFLTEGGLGRGLWRKVKAQIKTLKTNTRQQDRNSVWRLPGTVVTILQLHKVSHNGLVAMTILIILS